MYFRLKETGSALKVKKQTKTKIEEKKGKIKMKMKKRIGFLCLALNIVLLAYLCLGSVVALDNFSGVDEQEQIIEEVLVLGDENEQSLEGIELAVSPIVRAELEEELQPMMASSSKPPDYAKINLQTGVLQEVTKLQAKSLLDNSTNNGNPPVTIWCSSEGLANDLVGILLYSRNWSYDWTSPHPDPGTNNYQFCHWQSESKHPGSHVAFGKPANKPWPW